MNQPLLEKTPLSKAATAIENMQTVIFLLKEGAKLNKKVSEKKENIINLAKQEIEKEIEKEITEKKIIILLSGLQDRNSTLSANGVVKDVALNIICTMAIL